MPTSESSVSRWASNEKHLIKRTHGVVGKVVDPILIYVAL